MCLLSCIVKSFKDVFKDHQSVPVEGVPNAYVKKDKKLSYFAIGFNFLARPFIFIYKCIEKVYDFLFRTFFPVAHRNNMWNLSHPNTLTCSVTTARFSIKVTSLKKKPQ